MLINAQVYHLSYLAINTILNTELFSFPDMSLSLAPLHIPAIRPGFETDATAAVKRHPHPWAYDGDGFSSAQYHHASQYYLDRDRKPVFYGYPEAQFQVRVQWHN